MSAAMLADAEWHRTHPPRGAAQAQAQAQPETQPFSPRTVRTPTQARMPAPSAMHTPMPVAALAEQPAAASASTAEAAGVRLVGTLALPDASDSIAESMESILEDCRVVRTVLGSPSSCMQRAHAL